MLSIDIVTIGKLKQQAEANLEKRYLDRIKKAGPAQGIKEISILEQTESPRPKAEQRKSEEATILLKKTEQSNYIFALDETGKTPDSQTFADQLKTLKEDGKKRISFLIGGPDGHGQEVLSKAQLKLSLSKMTLPHGLARIILLEQLYRSITLWSGHPYHRI